MLDPIIVQLKKIEAAIHALRAPPTKHGAGVSPWHMWGGAANTEAFSGSGVPQVYSGQLANIDYKRPDCWHWILAARLIAFDGGADVSAPGDVVDVTCLFDVNAGLGRSVIVLGTPFERLNLRWAFPTPAPIGQLIWSTQATSPMIPTRSYPTAIPAEANVANVVDQIVAQTIVVNTRVTVQAVVGGVNVVRRALVELQAQFSPKTHIRPEWHLHTFPGGEEK